MHLPTLGGELTKLTKEQADYIGVKSHGTLMKGAVGTFAFSQNSAIPAAVPRLG